MSFLTVDGVEKAYGGIRALDGCSLQVDQGAIGGLIGPNGSGKTTLFNVVTGYERVAAGEVRLGGTALTNRGPERVFAAGVGRTFQISRVFPRLTLRENLAVGAARGLRRRSAAAARARADELLAFVGLGAHADALAGALSYGQRKLLELACILRSEPSIILLDEPAAGVNPTLLLALGDRIRTLNAQGVTFLIVEHDMEFVMSICDRVTVMHQGRAIATGAPDAVRRDPVVLDAYLGTELPDA